MGKYRNTDKDMKMQIINRRVADVCIEFATGCSWRPSRRACTDLSTRPLQLDSFESRRRRRCVLGIMVTYSLIRQFMFKLSSKDVVTCFFSVTRCSYQVRALSSAQLHRCAAHPCRSQPYLLLRLHRAVLVSCWKSL